MILNCIIGYKVMAILPDWANFNFNGFFWVLSLDQYYIFFACVLVYLRPSKSWSERVPSKYKKLFCCFQKQGFVASGNKTNFLKLMIGHDTQVFLSNCFNVHTNYNMYVWVSIENLVNTLFTF